MKRILLVALLVFAGCESKEERARAAVHQAAVSVLNYFRPIDPVPLPAGFDSLSEVEKDRIYDERVENAKAEYSARIAEASKQIEAAQRLYNPEAETARELARLKLLLDEARRAENKFKSKDLKAAATILEEQFRPRS